MSAAIKMRRFRTLQFKLQNFTGGVAPDGVVISPAMEAVTPFDCNSCKHAVKPGDMGIVYCPRDQVWSDNMYLIILRLNSPTLSSGPSRLS